MSWETRGANRYYYRRRKVGGRVIAEYIGSGLRAELTAAHDERARDDRTTAAAEWRAIVADDRVQARALAELDDLIRALTAGVMLANGYHQHRRQWRKVSEIVRENVR